MQVIVYIFRIKKYYECSCGKALAVDIVTVLVFMVIAADISIFLGVSLNGL